MAQTSFEVRSAGVLKRAAHQITAADIEWADVIFVMEGKHQRRLMREHRPQKPIIVLDIPDDFKCMDPELVGLLTAALEPFVGPIPASP